jgi:uncharacterized iron-regulated membrane protein
MWMGVGGLGANVLGLFFGLSIIAFPISAAAIVIGHVAQARTKRAFGTGSSYAAVGLVTGYIGVALGVLGLILASVVILALIGIYNEFNDTFEGAQRWISASVGDMV